MTSYTDTIPNSEKYFFSDFTRANYRHLLRLAKNNYQFCDYQSLPSKQPFVIWRHDLDFSVHAGRSLARIEAEEGVQATYFLLLHSQFYNLLEKEVSQCVKDILSLKHNIGLHFDPDYYDISTEQELEKYLAFEKQLLERLFDVTINEFSFHITTPFTQSCQEWQYAGMVNVYASYFQQQIAYCSDSNGYWRYERLEDILTGPKYPSLQVLTHPEYWQDEVLSPHQRVARCIQGRANQSWEWYYRTLQKHGRDDIDI